MANNEYSGFAKCDPNGALNRGVVILAVYILRGNVGCKVVNKSLKNATVSNDGLFKVVPLKVEKVVKNRNSCVFQKIALSHSSLYEESGNFTFF